MSLFVDSSIWYAAADRDDADNGRAIEVLSRGERLVTSDHVLVETWLLLRHRLGRRPAEQFWGALARGVAKIEPVITADLTVALSIGESFDDQDFSLVDRTSFAVMQRLGLRRAASLDQDFAVFRYGRGRREAFEIVR